MTWPRGTLCPSTGARHLLVVSSPVACAAASSFSSSWHTSLLARHPRFATEAGSSEPLAPNELVPPTPPARASEERKLAGLDEGLDEERKDEVATPAATPAPLPADASEVDAVTTPGEVRAAAMAAKATPSTASRSRSRPPTKSTSIDSAVSSTVTPPPSATAAVEASRVPRVLVGFVLLARGANGARTQSA